MKKKKILSLFCTAAMLFSIAAAPIGQASAYAVDVQESSDAATDMPAEVKARCEEGRNHVFDMSAYYSEGHGVDVDKMYSDEFEHDLIMPGDTFEFPIFVSESSTIFYMGQAQIGKDDKTVPGYHSVQDYYVKSPDLVDYGYYEYSGEVTPVTIETRTFTDKGDTSTCRFCTKYKNNTDCPLYIISGGGGSGPVAGKYTYAHGNINIYLLAPHYDIYYAQQPYSDGNPKPGDTAKLEQFFWRQGQLSDFTFPKYYWITDEPYTFTLPNPTAAGRHFVSWEKSKTGVDTTIVETDDYTTFTVDYTNGNTGWNANHWFGGIGYVTIAPGFVEGSTITFNGRGGTIKGYDQYIAEIPDYNEEPEEFGYALEDYTPVKDGDTFVGWCSNEDAYYDSFVTKDDESAIYQKYSSGWNRTKDIVLYAKWASETEESLEKNGWELSDDGTLWLLDNQGANAWNTARRADPTLSEKVTSFKLGFRDKTVTQIPDGCFYGCVNLTSAEFDDTVQSFGSWCFQGCTKLKSVKFGKGVSVSYGSFKDCPSLETVTFAGAPSYVSQAFFYAPLDLLVKVEDGDNEGFVTALGQSYGNTAYAYLLNDEERYPLTVNGELITENNLTVKCGDGTAIYDPKSNTLTLDNAELTKTLVPHSDISLNQAGIVSMLPELNVVVKGNLKTVENEAFYAQGDLNIKGIGENASLNRESSYSGKSYFITRSTGKLSINNVTATALNGYADEVNITKSVLNGGLSPFDSKTSTIVIKDSTIKQYEDDKGTYMPSISAANVTVENSMLDNVDFSIGTRCETITIKDSTVQLNSYINAKADSKLNIINSTIKGKGTVGHGVTNISEDNITLTKCEITKGGWKKAVEFEILPSLQVTRNTEYKVGPSIDSWYKTIGGDYTVVINRKDNGYIVGTFEKLTTNGNDVDTQNYTYVNSGDGFKQVVLKEAYLNTLTDNVYSFEAVFSDGTASFEVAVCYEINYSPAVLDENWVQSSGKDFTAAIYRDPSDGSDFSSLLKDVAVDGKTIDSKNYSVSMNNSASVNVVLKADYLKTLSEGKHTVLAVFADGKAEYSVVVKKDGTSPSPDTDTDKPISTDTDKDTDKPISTDTDIESGNLTYKILPDNTATITGFKGTEKEVTVPDKIDGVKVTKIDAAAFKNCSELESVTVSNNVTDIEEKAFEGCKNLKEIFVSDSVKNISATAFKDCGEFKLFASKGSYGEKFASQNNISFININTIFGDMDDDEKITSADSLLILRQSVSLEHFTDSQKFYADVDGDGSITSADALEVLRASVGLPTKGNIGEKYK